MAITKLQPFNLDTTANYTFANIATDNANLGNVATANFFIGSGNNLSNIQGANVTGAVSSATTSGTVTTNAQPNITSVGTLTGITSTGTVNLTGASNVALGPVANVKITSGSNGQYLQTDGTGNLSWSTVSTGAASNISNGNSNVNIPAANGNINLTAVGNTTMVITGTGANVAGTANIIGNIVGGGELNISGNGLFGGNLTVNGTLTYINSTTLSISDPIINLQTGPNGAAPVANTGKDVGTALNYYDTSAKIAWMGWDVSNAEIAFGSNVSISSEVVTFTSLANIRSGNADLGNNATANYFTGNGVYLTGITLAGLSNGNSNINIPVSNGNINFTAVGNANVVVITGTGANISGTANISGNLSAGNIIAGSGSGGNITNANVISANTFTASGNITAGNASLGNSVIANYFTGNFYGTANLATYATTANSVAGANVSGEVSYAATANSVAGANVSGAVAYATTANSVAGANVSGQVANALVSGTVYTNAQPNITSVGSLTGLTLSNATGIVDFTTTANVTLGAVANLHISGGTSAYVLSTDGAGNLSWVAQSGGGGGGASISNGNSNVNIPAANGNVNISAVGNANILVVTGTGANITGTANISGNLSAGNIIAGSGSGGNITNANVISANTFTASGNITAGNANLGNSVIANYFTGNFYGTANTATTAGTVTTAAQPNITSVGTLSSLTVTANITGGNLLGPHANGNSNVNIPAANGNINFTAVGNTIMVITGTGVNVAGTLNTGSGVITGNGNGLSSLVGANVTGQVANSLIAGTVYTNAQPNITSVGTLTDLSVSGNGVFGGNLTVNGTLTYINSTTLSISDPIINLQTGPNGAAPVANTGKDVGTALNYYDTSAKIAWMGWDISNAEISFGSNVSISSEVVTFTELANIRSGNASLGNNVSANFFTGTLTTNAQPNITSVGSLTGLTVSNATGVVDFTTTANVTLGAVANLHISGGTNGYVLSTDGSGALSWVAQSGGGGGGASISNGTSNVDIATSGGSVTTSVGGIANVLVVTTTGANITGTLNVTGQSNLGAVGNVVITGGTNGYVLSTNGSGGLSWIAAGGGGGGGASISNGTSNVDIATSGGNITMGVGGTANVVVVSTAGISAAIQPRIVTITDGTTVTMNSDTTDMAIQTNTQTAGTLTIAAPTGTPYQGQKLMFRLQSTNVQTFSWNAIFDGSTDLNLPTTSSGTSKYDYMGFIYNATSSKWDMISKNFGF